MRVSRIFLSLFLVTTCFGQLGNVNLKPLPGMQFVNRTHRLGRGLVAYLPFNERSGPTVFDLSGNGNTGTLVADTHWVPGKFGSVLDFDGTGDNVDFGAGTIGNLLNGTSAISFSMFINIRSRANQEGPFVFLVANGKTFLTLRFGSTDEFLFASRSQSADGLKSITTTSLNWILNRWYHIVGVVDYSSDSLFLYVDGQLVVSGSSVGFGSAVFVMNAVTDIDRLGQTGSAIGQFPFDGLLDIPMIYNRVLSASEIAEFYREPFAMFQKDDIALIASVTAPPPPGGQFIMIQMSMIPLFLIFTLVCFIRGKEG